MHKKLRSEYYRTLVGRVTATGKRTKTHRHVMGAHGDGHAAAWDPQLHGHGMLSHVSVPHHRYGYNFNAFPTLFYFPTFIIFFFIIMTF